MTLWRISKYRDLSGIYSALGSARWHTQGHRIVYAATSPGAAVLEVLVHLELTDDVMPPTMTLLEIGVPDDLTMHMLEPASGTDWRADVRITRRLGDDWLESGDSALARVPSAVVPRTENCLINPVHPDAARIQIVSATTFLLDHRFIKSVGAKKGK